ncbi:MAG: sulfatase-like hydrolase/transferase [Oscillospiraceae bacterium]|nr:sulfatase-like hydrolase/transferase [Oscillospiraceae bacterium]
MKSRKKIQKRLTIPGWLFAAVILVFDEFLLHLWTTDQLLPERLAVVVVFALATGTALALVISLLPPKLGKWLVVIVSLLLAVLYLMEYFIHDAYQIFMAFSVVAAGAEGVATDFLGTVLNLLMVDFWRILVYLAPIILYAVFAAPGKTAGKSRVILAVAMVVLYVAGFGLVFGISGYSAGLSTAYAFNSAVTDYGLHVALVLEGVNGSGSNEPAFTDTPVVPVTPTTPTTPTTPVDSGDSTGETEAPTEPIVYGDNVLDIDFAALAAAETNSNIASIHTYVASQTPSVQNEYTGLFEGKNLIFITAEAFTGAVIDPELTPTLYRMATEGMQFTDYFQPLWGAGTTGGEYSNVVGMAPGQGGCMMEAVEQDLFFTIGNQLQKLGYSSAAYHNNSYTYYSRHQTHTRLGYDIFMGVGNGMENGVRKAWPQSDLEMFDYTIPMHLDNQPFSLYYMTVSGHSPYSRGGNAMAKKNYDAVAHLDCSETIKCYLAANLELEYAMASLLRQLEEAGIADDTVIVISSDHYPYGLDESTTWGTSAEYLTELFGQPCNSRFVRDRNALIIWSGCIEDQDIVVEEPVCSLDILPTLSNLFGVEYDSRLLVGRDVFSDTPALVFWPDYSWKTEMGVYDSSTRTFTPAEGVTVEDGYVEYIASVVANKLTYSRSVQKYNYFNYVSPHLPGKEE